MQSSRTGIGNQRHPLFLTYECAHKSVEGNRVWYIARGRGTNTGPLLPFAPTPTNKELVNPPQACSLSFNEAGLVTKYTIGYVMDRTVGTTGGLGGLYGVLYSIGKPLPFPEAHPWNMSKRYRLFNKVGGFLQSLGNKKKKEEASDKPARTRDTSAQPVAAQVAAKVVQPDAAQVVEGEVDLSILRGSGSIFNMLSAQQELKATTPADAPVIAPKKSGTITVTLASGKTVDVPVSSYERK